MNIPLLFQPYTLRGLTFRNRIGVSPMCQYSCEDGMVGRWHLVHLGSRAIGGAGLVMAEATAVSPQGRISPRDTGIWKDEQIAPWREVASFISEAGAVPGIQIAHAGWKASTAPPWLGGKGVGAQEGGWKPVGVGQMPFSEGYIAPAELDAGAIDGVVGEWREAAVRASEAGFQLLEIHSAHGYLLHSFLSPISNKRTDDYGGSFENRARLALRVVKEVRSVWPEHLPLAMRISASDWIGGGWSIEDSVRLAKLARGDGVDLIDCSSGGVALAAEIPVGPGYQVAFAERVRRESGVPTAAVGMITGPSQAETILASGQADMVFLARELLRDPYWPLRAAQALGAESRTLVPPQYKRAW